jgi:hypothetical protein
LCPNCHSQTETYCGRNIKNQKSFDRIKVRQKTVKEKKQYFCKKCNSPIKDKRSGQCRSCSYKALTKASYPEPEELIKLIEEIGYVQVGNKLGVSDNAVRKHLTSKGYKLPKMKKPGLKSRIFYCGQRGTRTLTLFRSSGFYIPLRF